MTSLGEELTNVLFRREPTLLNADMDATARAAVEIANLLGCIMATLLVQRPDIYRTAMEAVFKQAHKSAEQTAKIAVPTLRQQ